jgi:hypothetical protein
VFHIAIVKAVEMSRGWEESVPVVESRTLPPDPAVMQGIGLNHTLPSAIADLVDNSLDAKADRVLIRFVRDGARLVALLVVDNGEGIAPDKIDLAMTVGGRREYQPGDLGRFGLGLKAASLGQADSVTVMSSHARSFVGRRWTVHGAARGFQCDVVDKDFSSRSIRRDWGTLSADQAGTVVRWDKVRSFPSSANPQNTDRYLDSTVYELTEWLGLVFHRILSNESVSIEVDVEDATSGERTSLTPVVPIDPFGYLRSPRTPYPVRIPLEFDDATLELHCHIWPPRSPLRGFRLHGGSVEEHEGFYYYRNDRLLQVGGWNGYSLPRRPLQLARVSIHLDGNVSRLFEMNPEKTRVISHPEGFFEKLETARTAEGISFAEYLHAAEEVYKRSSKDAQARRKVIPPGQGFAPAVRGVTARELDFIAGEDPIAIRWVDLEGVLFSVDLEGRKLLLNKRYRGQLAGEGGSSLNDAPTIKALLYLLTEPLFRSAHLGSREKDNLALWQAILTVAAESQ